MASPVWSDWPQEHPPASPSRRKGRSSDDEELEDVASNPEVNKKIKKGKAYVRAGLDEKKKKGNTEKAYERYCKGLKHLIDVTITTDPDDPRFKPLRIRINGYLGDAEKLKQELLSDQAAVRSAPPRGVRLAPPHGKASRRR